jgi:hypothetical protein
MVDSDNTIVTQVNTLKVSVLDTKKLFVLF